MFESIKSLLGLGETTYTKEQVASKYQEMYNSEMTDDFYQYLAENYNTMLDLEENIRDVVHQQEKEIMSVIETVKLDKDAKPLTDAQKTVIRKDMDKFKKFPIKKSSESDKDYYHRLDDDDLGVLKGFMGLLVVDELMSDDIDLNDVDTVSYHEKDDEDNSTSVAAHSAVVGDTPSGMTEKEETSDFDFVADDIDTGETPTFVEVETSSSDSSSSFDSGSSFDPSPSVDPSGSGSGTGSGCSGSGSGCSGTGSGSGSGCSGSGSGCSS